MEHLMDCITCTANLSIRTAAYALPQSINGLVAKMAIPMFHSVLALIREAFLHIGEDFRFQLILRTRQYIYTGLQPIRGQAMQAEPVRPM